MTYVRTHWSNGKPRKPFGNGHAIVPAATPDVNRDRAPTAHLYVRVSTDKQENSQEHQKQLLMEDWEKSLKTKWPVFAEYPDFAVSAGKVPLCERPEGRRMAMSVNPGDIIVIAKGDRAFRSTRDMLETIDKWLKQGVFLRLLDWKGLDVSTPEGRCMFTIRIAFAEYERSLISRRTQEVMRWRQKHGLPTGGKKWGLKIAHRWKDGKRYAYYCSNEHDRALARRVIDMRVNQGMVWHDIFWALHREKVKTSKGKLFSDPSQCKKWAAWELTFQECKRREEAGEPATVQEVFKLVWGKFSELLPKGPQA